MTSLNLTRRYVQFGAALAGLVLLVGMGLLTPHVAFADTPVTNCNDSGAGSLRDALAAEPANGRVFFNTDCPAAGPLTLTTAAGGSFLTLTKNVVIDGNGRDVVIRGDGSANRIFDVGGVTVTFQQLAIENGNSGGVGGAINVTTAGSNVTIIDTTLANNQGGFGGAIAVNNGNTVTIRNSTFSGNRATTEGGGAIRTRGGGDDITIINSTFSGNSAVNGGGAIHSTLGGAVHIYNSTFYNNNGGVNGALRITSGAAFDLQNTILASNSNTNCSGSTFTDNGNNLADDATCGTIPATPGPLNIDGTLADNGGRTQTHALLPDSPAIDAGNDAICTGAVVGGVDQRGQLRTEDIPTFGTTTCDIGAYEFIRPGVSIDDVTVTEGGTASFTVSLSRTIQKSVVITYTTADNTAQSSHDYTAASGAVTVPAGNISAPLDITTIDDAWDEPDSETFFVNLTAVSAWGVLSDTQGVGTINDNDPLPALSINDVTVAENAGPATFQVTLSAATSRTVTVNYVTAAGTATEGVDYSAASGTLTFNPGQTSQNISVTVLNDTAVEPTETFFVNLSGETNATLADAQGQGQITNDDVAAPEIAVLDGATAVPDGTGDVNFGSTTVGTPVNKTFTVQNNGTGNLTLTPPINLPSGFSLVSSFGSTTVPPAGSTTFVVRLDAAAAGTFSGQLSFANNDSDENPYNFTIRGTVSAAAGGGQGTSGGGDDEDDDHGQPPPPPPSAAASAGQEFNCWPWLVVMPPLAVPNGAVNCLPELGATLPAPASFRFLGHSTDVTVQDAGGSAVTQFSSPLKICFRYTQVELDAAGGNPANFLIQTFRNGAWESLPTTPESDSGAGVLGRVCGAVNHLTLFALFARDNTAPAANPLASVKVLPETGVGPVGSPAPAAGFPAVPVAGAAAALLVLAALVWLRQR